MNCTRGLFSNSKATLFGSTFDAFVDALLAHPTAAASLPVLTKVRCSALREHNRPPFAHPFAPAAPHPAASPALI